jgi:hypothetical protein
MYYRSYLNSGYPLNALYDAHPICKLSIFHTCDIGGILSLSWLFMKLVIL